MSKLSVEIKKACTAIANAEELAKTAIAKAAENAKVVVATDAANAVKINNGNGKFDNILKQISLWTGILSLAGVLIGSFIFLTSPAQDNNLALQLQAQQIKTQQKTIDEITKTQQNDTREAKTSIDKLNTTVNNLNTSVATLTAIINERIPAKK